MRTELTGEKCRHHGAETDTDDFGTDVLQTTGRMQSNGPGRVSFEARQAKAHVPGIAQLLKYGSEEANDQSGSDDAGPGGKEVFQLRDSFSPGDKRTSARSAAR